MIITGVEFDIETEMVESFKEDDKHIFGGLVIEKEKFDSFETAKKRLTELVNEYASSEGFEELEEALAKLPKRKMTVYRIVSDDVIVGERVDRAYGMYASRD